MRPADFPKDWWCCLAVPERAIATLCVSKVAALQGFITKEEYEDAWAAQSGGSLLERSEIFATIWDLTAGVYVPCEECEPVDVYYFGSWWLEFLGFAVDPGLACAQRCFILRYSD